MWVPIIRSWALTRGFALHPGTRNRYKIRYTTNQHRPPSRQVNDHGRVSGTHTPRALRDPQDAAMHQPTTLHLPGAALQQLPRRLHRHQGTVPGRMLQPRLRQAARYLPFVRPRRDRSSTVRQNRHVRRMHRILLQTRMHLHQKHPTRCLTQKTRHETLGAHRLQRQLRAGRSTLAVLRVSIDEAERRGSRRTSGHGRPLVPRGSEELPQRDDEEDERQPHRSLDQRPPVATDPPDQPDRHLQVVETARCNGLINEYRNAA